MAESGRKPRNAEELHIARQLGANIKQARILADMTGDQVGRLIGRSKQTVSGWESGANSPDLFVLPRLAEVLRVSPAWLLAGTLRRLPQRNGIESIARRLAEHIGLSRMRELLDVPAEDLEALLAARRRETQGR